MRVVGVIPARWGSSRFPGKSLAPLCGKPLIQWVIERSRQARRLDALWVATDDERIARAARASGADAILTEPELPSGTDRVAASLRGRPGDVILNIQGDEPLIAPDLVDRLAAVLADAADWQMATAAAPLAPEEAGRPSICKVVMDAEGRALYFSRAAIPCVRDSDFRTERPLYWRHIGLYAYRRAFLEAFVAEPPCLLERAECLEQLRALHLGARIKVERTDHLGGGVDTPDDVPAAEAVLRRLGWA